MSQLDRLGNANPTERQAFVEMGLAAAITYKVIKKGGGLITKDHIREALARFYVASLDDPEMSLVVAGLLGNRSTEFRMQVFSNEMMRRVKSEFQLIEAIILLVISEPRIKKITLLSL